MNIKDKLTTLIPFVLDEEAAAKGQKSLGVELEENETEGDEIWDPIHPGPPVYLDDAVPKRPSK